jgi:hypothetical protein
LKHFFLAAFSLLSITLYAQTPAEEWHEFCEMTVHTKVRGWKIESSKKKVNVLVESLDCEIQSGKTFSGQILTDVTGKLKLRSIPGAKLKLDIAYYQHTLDGQVSKDIACAHVHALADQIVRNGHVLPAVVERELIKQEEYSTKNVTQFWIEDININVSKDLSFGNKAVKTVEGLYCSKKPLSI